MDGATPGIGLAFIAGAISFLSPCVFPVVPGYIGFVTGLSMDELRDGTVRGARREAAIHAALFVGGFSLLFMALGASATLVGGALRDALPLLQKVGGVVIVIFGLFMLRVLRIPTLMRERRLHLSAKPAGKAGSVVAGVAFGAGWTPCIGPVLATVLLYAGFEETMGQGMLLLGAYALGLGIPFFLSALALNWYLAGASRIRHWIVPIERATGVMLLLLGVLLFSGEFARITEYLARFSPAIDLGL